MDLIALAPTLNDERTAALRSALTAQWDEIRSLYSSWGIPTVRPGQLACGAKLAQCDASPEGVRELAARVMGSKRDAGPSGRGGGGAEAARCVATPWRIQ